MMKYLYLNSVKYKFKIPVIIELRYFNEYEASILDNVVNKLLTNRVKSSKKILDLGLKRGNFIFLIDGYDEVYRDKKYVIRTQIVEFMDRFPNNIFVITSRPGGGVETIPRFEVFKVKPLQKNDIISLIKKTEVLPSRQKMIISDIQILTGSNERYSLFRNYLSNPLLLSMFLKIYKYFPEVPSSKQIFYRNVFDTLYSHHDAVNNDGLRRQRHTGLRRVEFEKFLNAFCYITYFKRELVFDRLKLINRINTVLEHLDIECDTEDMIYDLRTSIGVLILDGVSYTFPHRSLQEYFCVLFISKLETDQKRKAYLKYIDLLKFSPDYGEYNFWELASEVDNVSFVEYFIVSYLKHLITALHGVDGIENFLKIFEIQLYFDKIIREKHIAIFAPKDIPNYPPGEYEYNSNNLAALRKYIIKTDNDLKNKTFTHKDLEANVFIVKNRIPLVKLKFNESALPYKVLKFLGFDSFPLFAMMNHSEKKDEASYNLGKVISSITIYKKKELYVVDESMTNAFSSTLKNSATFVKQLSVFNKKIEVKLDAVLDSKENTAFSVDKLLNL